MSNTNIKIDELKDKKILVIVESPNKCATLTKIFKSLGFKKLQVLASVGHITLIKDNPKSYKNTGIHPDNDFKVDFVVDPKKKDVVSKLKKASDDAELVFLMSDPDREGSAISTHLKQELKIPEKKYYRVVTHEITESGVKTALSNMGKIDKNLSSAAETRQVVDKLIGYTLSPVVQRSINCRSAGRCQSAGLKLVVEREEEIINFKPEKYWDLYLHFTKNITNFKAKYIGTPKKEIKKFTSLEECHKVMKDCEGKNYIVDSIEKKEQKESPKPPFTTSTFQQEANKLYGMSIDAAMSCAQKLFEGISVMGDHVALITYIRTDDSSMSPEFAEILGDYVRVKYGKNYYAPVKKGTKANDNIQEAHECLRVVNVNMTPADLSKYITDKNLLKIYKLIWERTVMSSMAPAIISDTQYNMKNGEHIFAMHSREVIFDGYRRVHVDEEDTIGNDEVVKETFTQGEQLQNTVLKEEAKETTPPSRYTEASFIKELDKRGIGRPSTFATIVQTVLAENRGYCVIEDKKMVPTALGIKLTHFLEQSFLDFIGTDVTKTMEENLDLISEGKLSSLDFLKGFYQHLDETSSKVSKTVKKAASEKTDLICPQCGGHLVIRKGFKGQFYGCEHWRPNSQGCNYTRPIEEGK